MYKIYKVLLVEDDPTHAMIVKQLLHQSKDFNFQVQHATYLSGAVSLLTKENFDVVLLDLNLPDSQGTDTIEKIRHTNSSVPIMSITGYEATGSLSRYLNNGIQDYLDKKDLLNTKLSARIQFAIQRKQNEISLAMPSKPISISEPAGPPPTPAQANAPIQASDVNESWIKV